VTHRKLGGPIGAVLELVAMAMSWVELSDSDDERGANVVEGNGALRAADSSDYIKRGAFPLFICD
jgi:hypothetical protein